MPFSTIFKKFENDTKACEGKTDLGAPPVFLHAAVPVPPLLGSLSLGSIGVADLNGLLVRISHAEPCNSTLFDDFINLNHKIPLEEAYYTELWSDALADDKVAQQCCLEAATAAVDAATKVLDAAELTESSMLSDLQSAIEDASSAAQKALQAYNVDRFACPSVDTAKQAAGH